MLNGYLEILNAYRTDAVAHAYTAKQEKLHPDRRWNWQGLTNEALLFIDPNTLTEQHRHERDAEIKSRALTPN